MNYREAVAALEKRVIFPMRPPGLDRTRAGLERISARGGEARRNSKLAPSGESPSKPLLPPEQVIVVAGTNGKGSVCATLEALLLSAGERVGLYTSPHLVETRERIRINGADIGEQDFADAYEFVEARTGDLDLSHFEVLTLMAAHVFSRAGLDRVILEIGLGGTWDAVNAIEHELSVITPIGMDHENLLGPDLVSIARNKFGVISPPRESRPHRVVHAPLPAELKMLAAEVAAATASSWTEAPGVSLEVARGGPASLERPEPIFTLKSPWGDARIALPGRRGAENSALALKAFEQLGYNPARQLDALECVRWPGRMERLELGGGQGTGSEMERTAAPAPPPCPVYLSGDHNPQGAESLVELLENYERERVHFLVGIGKDKNADGILSPLSRVPAAKIYLTTTPFKGRAIDEYGDWLTRAEWAEPDPWTALRRIRAEASPRDLIVVTGSIYLAGEIRRTISARSPH